MVRRFRHRGLKRFYEQDDARKIRADQRNRVQDVLFYLDQAQAPEDLDLPGYRLHRLKGELQGIWMRDDLRQLADYFSLCRR